MWWKCGDEQSRDAKRWLCGDEDLYTRLDLQGGTFRLLGILPRTPVQRAVSQQWQENISALSGEFLCT